MEHARDASRPATSVDPWKRRASYLQDAILVVVSAVFLYVHARHVLVDGSITSVGFALEQAVLVGIFLFRRRSYATSTRPSDWLVAAVGGWLSFAFQPQTGASLALGATGTAVQFTGLLMAAGGFLYLGRSFGIVAANRGLKVRGPYRLVRHPIYLAHLVTSTGFLIANFHPINLALYTIVLVAQLLRIRAEERVLTETAEYDAYRATTRWRIIPGLY